MVQPKHSKIEVNNMQELNGRTPVSPAKSATEKKLAKDPAKAIGRHLQSVKANDPRVSMGIDLATTAMAGSKNKLVKGVGRTGQEFGNYYDPSLNIARSMRKDYPGGSGERANTVGSELTFMAGNFTKDMLMEYMLGKLAKNPALKKGAESASGVVNILTDPVMQQGLMELAKFLSKPDSEGKSLFQKIPGFSSLLDSVSNNTNIGATSLLNDKLKGFTNAAETGDYYLTDPELAVQATRLLNKKNAPPITVKENGGITVNKTAPMTRGQRRAAGVVDVANKTHGATIDAIKSPWGQLYFDVVSGLMDPVSGFKNAAITKGNEGVTTLPKRIGSDTRGDGGRRLPLK
jgi:hypothetical protein